jgi:sirohydrochlorin cobaltochelatase
MSNHIILTAFGTTTRAKDTYHFLESRIAPKFPDCQIHWSFSSPTVRRGAASTTTPLPSLADIVSELRNPDKIVIQSLHVLPGHEFDRIVTESHKLPVPTALGMPLLHEPSDFSRVAKGLKDLITASKKEATLILAHGTDHPCRASYPLLQKILHEQIGPRVFFTTIEKPSEPPELIIQKIHEAGYKKVFCIPFLLVAGMHFLKDINGDHQSSWRNLLKAKQIEIDLHERGLAYLDGVDEIFCDHIDAAFGSMTT